MKSFNKNKLLRYQSQVSHLILDPQVEITCFALLKQECERNENVGNKARPLPDCPAMALVWRIPKHRTKSK